MTLTYRSQWLLLFILLLLYPGNRCFGAWPGGKGVDEIMMTLPYAVPEKEVIDLGLIKQGSRSSGEIRILNKGVKDFVIARVRSSCGLMIPTWPDGAVGHNEEAVVRFRYDSSRPGPFERKVVIHTNAYQRTLVVTVKGEVVR